MNLAKLKKTPTYNIMLSFIFLTLGNGLLLCLVQIKSFLYSLISCQNSLTYFHQWRIRWMMEKKLSLTEIDSYWINNVTRVTTAIHGVNHNSQRWSCWVGVILPPACDALLSCHGNNWGWNCQMDGRLQKSLKGCHDWDTLLRYWTANIPSQPNVIVQVWSWNTRGQCACATVYWGETCQGSLLAPSSSSHLPPGGGSRRQQHRHWPTLHCWGYLGWLSS